MSDKDSRAEIEKVFTSFDVNRAVNFLNYSGKNHSIGIKKSRSRSWIRFDRRRDWKDVC